MLTLEEFSALVVDIYDAALDPTLWDQTLKKVATAAGGSAGGVGVFDRRHRQPGHIIASNYGPAKTRMYVEYYRRLDPIAPTVERTPLGEIVIARAIVTETHLREEFYRDWANRSEVGDAVFVKVMSAETW
jgi:hypothetical protein